MTNLGLKGKEIALWTFRGFRYNGVVLDETDAFLIFEDRKSVTRVLNKSRIDNIEVAK